MSYDPKNPFASPSMPPVATAGVAGYPTSIAYTRMYSYVFDNPNWMMNILFGALCSLIPIIGPLPMLGYQFEVIQTLLATQGTRYPDFDFNRFVDYLMGGLWPFLVQMVASLVLTPIMMIIIGVPMVLLFVAAAAAGDDAAPIVFLIGLPLFVLLIIPIAVVPAIFLMPMMLRAGLTQDFMEGFKFDWTMDFVKKTWFEIFLAMLFLAFTATLLAFLGILACYIGMFAVMPLIVLAQAHMLYQLYLIYLSRGGKPVPIKPTTSMAPPSPPLTPPTGPVPPRY
jgi:hypothetical protein